MAVTLQLDDGSGRTYQLREGANVIGRGQDAQFRLPDTGVSRRHLEIRWDGQVALLSDLNSTNGTTVNNAPVQEWQLADGDVIRLGHPRSSFAFTEVVGGSDSGGAWLLHLRVVPTSKYRDDAEVGPVSADARRTRRRHEDGEDAGCRDWFCS